MLAMWAHATERAKSCLHCTWSTQSAHRTKPGEWTSNLQKNVLPLSTHFTVRETPVWYATASTKSLHAHGRSNALGQWCLLYWSLPWARCILQSSSLTCSHGSKDEATIVAGAYKITARGDFRQINKGNLSLCRTFIKVLKFHFAPGNFFQKSWYEFCTHAHNPPKKSSWRGTVRVKVTTWRKRQRIHSPAQRGEDRTNISWGGPSERRSTKRSWSCATSSHFGRPKKNCAINWCRYICCKPPGHPSRTTSAYSNWSPPGVRSVPAERGERGLPGNQPSHWLPLAHPSAIDTSFETKENQHLYFLLRGNAYRMSRIYENTLNLVENSNQIKHQNPSPYLPYLQTLMVRRLELKAILVNVQSSSPVIASVHRSELLMKDPEIDILSWTWEGGEMTRMPGIWWKWYFCWPKGWYDVQGDHTINKPQCFSFSRFIDWHSRSHIKGTSLWALSPSEECFPNALRQQPSRNRPECVFSRRTEFDIAVYVSRGRCCTVCPSLHSSWYVCCHGRAIVLGGHNFALLSDCEVHWSLRSFEWCLAVSVPLCPAMYGHFFVVLISCQVCFRSGGRGVVVERSGGEWWRRVSLRSVAEERCRQTNVVEKCWRKCKELTLLLPGF